MFHNNCRYFIGARSSFPPRREINGRTVYDFQLFSNTIRTDNGTRYNNRFATQRKKTCSCVYADDIGPGERIVEQRLNNNACPRKTRACKNSRHRARQPHIQQDARRCAFTLAAQNRPYLRQRDACRPNT